MLSRKYYKKLAEIFKNGYIAEMQWALIDFLKSDNPNFNEDTFLKAMEIDLEKLKREYQ